MKKTKKVNYEPPRVKITKVALERGIAVTVSVDLYDWEDGGEIGKPNAAGDYLDGGDIELSF